MVHAFGWRHVTKGPNRTYMDEDSGKTQCIKRALDQLHDSVTDDLKTKVEQVEQSRQEIAEALDVARSQVASSSESDE